MSQPPSEPNRTAQVNPWLDPAARAQLERDLDDIPELMDQLERNYGVLLARGARDRDDPWIRYPIDPGAFDLADSRLKGETDTDAAGMADIGRRAGARRLGVLPSLEQWLRMLEADMLDEGAEHRDPILDDTGTVTTAAGWLRTHLDWIGGRQEVIELAAEVRDIVEDLERIVGPAYARPDDTTSGTIPELSRFTGIPVRKLYRWADAHWITPVDLDQAGRPIYLRRDVEAIRRWRSVA